MFGALARFPVTHHWHIGDSRWPVGWSAVQSATG
jgi:hypothetical protein